MTPTPADSGLPGADCGSDMTVAVREERARGKRPKLRFFGEQTLAGFVCYRIGGRMLVKLCGLVVLGMLALAGMVTHLVAGPDDWWWRDRTEFRERMHEAHERALEAR